MSLVRSRLQSIRQALGEDGTLRNVLKNTGWLTGSSAAIILLSTVQGILTARLLGVAVWGMLAVAMSFSSVFAKLLSFRMNDFVVKWVTQLTEDGSERAATAFRLAVAGDAGSAVLAFALVEMLAGWGASVFAKNADFAMVFRLTGLIVLFQAGRESLLGMLQVNRSFRALSFVQVGCRAATVCGVAFVFVAGWGLYGVVAAIVGGEALTMILMWVIGIRAANVVLPDGWMRSRLVRLGELEHEMWSFALLTNVGSTLKLVQSEGDVLVLGLLRNPTEVAYYKLAKSIAVVVYLPMMPMVNSTYPEFSSAAAKGEWVDFRRLMRRGSKVAAAWFIPATLGAAVLAPFAIGLLYGKTFLPAAVVLDVLLVGVAMDGILFWSGSALLAMGQAGYVARNGLETAVVKLALALLLVPAQGAIAMAFAATVATTVMNLRQTRHLLAALRKKESAVAGGFPGGEHPPGQGEDAARRDTSDMGRACIIDGDVDRSAAGPGVLVAPRVRLLFVAAGGFGQASSRYRIYQFQELLKQAGFAAEVLPWKAELKPRERLEQLLGLAKMSRDYDIIYFHRVTLRLPSFLLIRQLILHQKVTIYDLDDAIYAVSSATIAREQLELEHGGLRAARIRVRRARRRVTVGEGFSDRKKPLERMLRNVDAVVAGNRALAEMARRSCDQVFVVPTVLDVCDLPVKQARWSDDAVVIGWVGHGDNLMYLDAIVPVFRALKDTYGDRVRFRIVSSAPLAVAGLDIENKRWTLDEEVSDVLLFDIGIMPLTDDEWTRGKCAFKALLYGALGIPSVVSPVGANKDAVLDGKTGFLADSDNDWVDKLSVLVEDAELRARLGSAARTWVAEGYSVPAAFVKLQAILRGVAR